MRLAGMLVVALVVGGCAGAGEQALEGDAVAAERDLVGSMEVKVSPSTVRLVLHVTNTSDVPLELRFNSSQRFDFVVATASGEEVWRWSDEMGFMQALSRDTLGPGESWDMDAVWDPGDHAGEFVATGVLTAREHELSQSAAFQLP